MIKSTIGEIKYLTRFSIPFIAMLIAQKFLQLVSAFMMGVLGVDALGAGVLSGSFYLIFIIFGIGILNTVGILIARAFGAEDKEKIKINIFSAFVVSLIFAIPAMFFIWYLPDVFLFMEQDNQIVSLSAGYLHAVVWGFPAILFFSVLREFLAAVNHQKIVSYIVAFAIPFNILINYSLVSGGWGLPSLSITGIGYANAMTEWFMFLSLFIYILMNKKLNQYFLGSHLNTIQRAVIIEIFRVGIPSGFTLSFEVIMSAMLTAMMGYFGAFSLAAHQIAFQCVSFIYMVPLGISLASGLRISQSIGANDNIAVAQTIRAGISMGVIFSLLLFPFFIFMPDLFISIFISQEQEGYQEVRDFAVAYLAIGAFFLCFDCLQGIISGFLRGFKDTFMTMMITILSYLVVALGGGYYLAFNIELAGLGLWWGLALGLASSCILLGIRLYQKLNKLTIIIGKVPQANTEYA